MIKGIPVILPFGNYSSPKIYYINNTIYVTITEYETKKVFAFYSNGNRSGGFPVYGTSVADLANADNDKAIEMVVQSDQDELHNISNKLKILSAKICLKQICKMKRQFFFDFVERNFFS